MQKDFIVPPKEGFVWNKKSGKLMHYGASKFTCIIGNDEFYVDVNMDGGTYRYPVSGDTYDFTRVFETEQDAAADKYMKGDTYGLAAVAAMMPGSVSGRNEHGLRTAIYERNGKPVTTDFTDLSLTYDYGSKKWNSEADRFFRDMEVYNLCHDMVVVEKDGSERTVPCMASLIALTPEQKQAFDDMMAALRRLREAGGTIFYELCTDVMYPVNGNMVEDGSWNNDFPDYAHIADLVRGVGAECMTNYSEDMYIKPRKP